MNEVASCDNSTSVQEGKTMVGSVVLFVAGMIGNVLALVILFKHKRKSKRTSVFYVLVTGLVGTDLSGKCLISPVVFASYARNQTLKALSEGQVLCSYFSVSMSFFGLSSTVILLAMAVECWLSISHPFFYQEHITKRGVLVLLPLVYTSCLLFCLLPLLEIGSYKQYCPGTWCFINMTPVDGNDRVYSVLYASLLGLLIAAVLVCNLSVGINLAKMFRRQRERSNSTLNFRTGNRRFAHSEEVDHLVLLVLMTVLFVVCSAPLTVRAYIGAFAPDNKDSEDLIALRLASVNSIVNPWVFIIFRTSIVRKLASTCCNYSSTANMDSLPELKSNT